MALLSKFIVLFRLDDNNFYARMSDNSDINLNLNVEYQWFHVFLQDLTEFSQSVVK